MTWKLALRHLIRHWRVNLLLLTIMILGATLLASMPMLALSIARESFSQSLQGAPIHARNIIIQGKSKTDELPEEIELALGNLLHETISVREGDIMGFPIISKSKGDDLNLYPATLVLKLKSFDRLDERVRILEGQLPESAPLSDSAHNAPVYEAVIGAEAARRTGLELGDEVSPAGGSYHIRIVGIVEPLYPDADIWWGDGQLLPFSSWRRISFSPDVDEWNVSLLLTPEMMISKVRQAHYWRIILDHKKITATNAPLVREALTGLQSDLSDRDLMMRTELIDLIV